MLSVVSPRKSIFNMPHVAQSARPSYWETRMSFPVSLSLLVDRGIWLVKVSGPMMMGAGMNSCVSYRPLQFSCIFQRSSYERVFRFEGGFQFRYVFDYVVNRDCFALCRLFPGVCPGSILARRSASGQRKALYTCYVCLWHFWRP